MQEINERVDPFAMVTFVGRPAMVDEAATLGIWTSTEQGSRPDMMRRAPFERSVYPDWEDSMANTAAFVCAKLAGRPARYSGDPTARSTTRKFAATFTEFDDPGGVGYRLFLRGVRERCPHAAGEILEESKGQSDLDVARWRAAGVTTVVDFGSSFAYPGSAESSGWFPEWLLVPGIAFRSLDYRVLFPQSQSANAFAVTSVRRLAERREDQEYYQVSKASCPDCVEQIFPRAYEELLLMFTGIQAAGPQLTIANVDRGLHAIPPRASANPWAPAAYFAPANWTFFKDMMLARWDRAGLAPGGQPGCWRLVDHGKRYRTEDWESNPGDVGFDRFDEWPCQGES
jgi:hypothetical protein